MTAARRCCVIVGAGPGGLLLGYLLARAGVAVTVLETHHDFDRDFRGDSLHPYTLELFNQLGLADKLLRLPHHKARHFRFHTPTGSVTTADYGQLGTAFNYVALMPQARFLEFLAAEAARWPNFELRMGCRARGLVEHEAHIRGVELDTGAPVHAELVVAADGRYSRMRRAAGVRPIRLGATTDLLWFRLPHHELDPPDADVDLFFGRHQYVGLLGSPAGWQVGVSLPKGGYAALRDAGIEVVRDVVARQVPWLADRVSLLTDFDQTTLLSVDISRLRQWWRPGLLFIGDAAHVISPVGGNGILMAVQDAVATANLLSSPLAHHAITDDDLERVQRQREPALRRVQAAQVRVERRSARARRAGRPLVPAGLLRMLTALPGAQARAAKANAYGPQPPTLARRIRTAPEPANEHSEPDLDSWR
ncbi:FAD-dependent oxidoreductase [Actinocatenispora comari]|jgi:2-polyprenyl-6-methoxyphenol hydroxylase-like FAD-dependent oxidoreductase|uniref:FAD-dependent oxidoreductase n=1 Tax=Actinocatenispora comari TaxID=2807577 RepID=A0A8J4AHS5_9ACTN|nr:FAD-dependent oxidoreductase [Actinocatenispora comari]GIL30934.1 FAD-dependent oxidoreductase [Actinocatenispora comari]